VWHVVAICHVIGHVTTMMVTDSLGMETVRPQCGDILYHGDGSKESGVESAVGCDWDSCIGCIGISGGELE